MSIAPSEVGNVDIVVEELGPGWLKLHAVMATEFQREVELDRIPGLIDRTLTAYLLKRPGLRVRATLPLVEAGLTVAVHLWYDPA